MKQLVELWPIVLFFIVYQWQGIYTATATMIVGVAIQSAFLWFKNKTLKPVQWLTLVLVVVFGGATLIVRDPRFIQWKPTVLQWILGLVFAASHFISEKRLIQRLLDSQLELPQTVWNRLSQAWIAFFLFSGGVNLYVAYNYEEATWVNFKLFGLLGLTFVFVLAQGVWLSKYLPKDGA